MGKPVQNESDLPRGPKTMKLNGARSNKTMSKRMTKIKTLVHK